MKSFLFSGQVLGRVSLYFVSKISGVSSQFSRTLTLGFLFMAPGLFTSCGGEAPANNIVTDIKLETALEGEDVKLKVGATFNLGNMSMTAVTLPIVDPVTPLLEYGRISFLPTLDGQNEISFEVNLSAAAEVTGGRATLPNGDDLPIGGIEDVNVLELSIDSINAKIYLALEDGAVMVGFGIAIAEFDVLGNYIGQANIFPGFNIKGVRGIVGLFTSTEELQSGLAFLLDLSSLITPDMIDDLLNGVPYDEAKLEESQMIARDRNRAESIDHGRLDFSSFESDPIKARDGKRMLYKMSRAPKREIRPVAK